ncbi:hypothetical protein GGF31_004923 [Allomyces arbusculus]|nr:hypothetical protein GGF31_004923 [Allomyces arbusculus]
MVTHDTLLNDLTLPGNMWPAWILPPTDAPSLRWTAPRHSFADPTDADIDAAMDDLDTGDGGDEDLEDAEDDDAVDDMDLTHNDPVLAVVAPTLEHPGESTDDLPAEQAVPDESVEALLAAVENMAVADLKDMEVMATTRAGIYGVDVDKPEKHALLQNLPYYGTICERKEGQALLAEAKARLHDAIAAGNWVHGIPPATRRVHLFLAMKYALPIQTRIDLIQLMYEIIVTPNMDMSVVSNCVRLAVRLMKKERLLEKHGATFTFHWRPVYTIIRDAFTRKSSAPKQPALYMRHLQTLGTFLDHAERYFPASTTDEVLEELLPLVSTTDMSSTTMAFTFFNFLLPTRHVTRKHIDTILLVWQQFVHCTPIDVAVTDWLARIARDQPDLVRLDDLPRIYAAALRNLKLPVGSTAAGAAGRSRLSYGVAFDLTGERVDLLQLRRQYSRTRVISKFMVLTLHLPGAIDHLHAFIKAFESFTHPSNHGSWTGTLARLLRGLASELSTRVSGEYGPCPPVVVENVRAIADWLRGPVTWAMYAKDAGAAQAAQTALRHLVALDPAAMMPALLDEHIYPALGAGDEGGAGVGASVAHAHRTVTALAALNACASALVHPDMFPAGPREHVVNVLFLVLPGIDINDHNKTLTTLLFIAHVMMVFDFANTDRFPHAGEYVGEDWIVQYLARIFTLLENMDAEGPGAAGAGSQPGASKGTASGGIERNMAQALLFATHAVFAALPPPLFDLALRKLLEWLRSHTLLQSAATVGRMVSSIIQRSPKTAVPRVLEWLEARMRDEIKHGAGSRATLLTRGATTEQGTATLVWYLHVLSTTVRMPGNVLVEPTVRSAVERIISMIMDLPDRQVFRFAHTAVASVVYALTAVYAVDATPVHADAGGQGNHTQYLLPHEVSVHWHVPQPEELEWAQALVQKYAAQVASGLTKLMDDVLAPAGESEPDPRAALDTFAVQHAWVQHLSLLTALQRAVAGWRHEYMKREKYVMPRVLDARPIRKLVGKLLLRAWTVFRPLAADRDDSQAADTVKPSLAILQLLVAATRAHLTNFGAGETPAASRAQELKVLKSMMRLVPGAGAGAVMPFTTTPLPATGMPAVDFDGVSVGPDEATRKRAPIALHLRRAALIHARHCQANVVPLPASPTDRQLMENLYAVTDAPFSTIRNHAQAALVRGLRTHPAPRNALVMRAIERLDALVVLPTVNDAAVPASSSPAVPMPSGSPGAAEPVPALPSAVDAAAPSPSPATPVPGAAASPSPAVPRRFPAGIPPHVAAALAAAKNGPRPASPAAARDERSRREERIRAGLGLLRLSSFMTVIATHDQFRWPLARALLRITQTEDKPGIQAAAHQWLVQYLVVMSFHRYEVGDVGDRARQLVRDWAKPEEEGKESEKEAEDKKKRVNDLAYPTPEIAKQLQRETVENLVNVLVTRGQSLFPDAPAVRFHWRAEGMVISFLCATLVNVDMPLSPDLGRAVMHGWVHAHPHLRQMYESALIMLLGLIKSIAVPKSRKTEVVVDERFRKWIETEERLTPATTGGKAPMDADSTAAGDAAMEVDEEPSSGDPDATPRARDPSEFYFDNSWIGWLCYPSTAKVYIRNDPQCASALPLPDTVVDCVEALRAALRDAAFLAKVFHYQTLEQGGAQQHQVRFSWNRAGQLLRLLFTVIGPDADALRLVIEHAQKQLRAPADQPTQIKCGLEWAAALVRVATKHWAPADRDAVTAALLPLIEDGMRAAVPDTLHLFRTALRFILVKRDPRRSAAVIQMIVRVAAAWHAAVPANGTAAPAQDESASAGGAFSEACKWAYLRDLVDGLGQRGTSELPALVLAPATAQLAHPYKLVRDTVATVVADLISTSFRPRLPNVAAVVDAASAGTDDAPWYVEAAAPVHTAVAAMHDVWTSAVRTESHALAAKSIATVLGTVARFYRPLPAHTAIPVLIGAVLPLVTSDDAADVEASNIAIMSAANFDLATPQRTRAMVDTWMGVISAGASDAAVEGASGSPRPTSPTGNGAGSTSWQIKLKALQAVQVVYFRHLPLLTVADRDAIVDQVGAVLLDAHPEVRALAGVTLAGIVQCSGDSPSNPSTLTGSATSTSSDTFHVVHRVQALGRALLTTGPGRSIPRRARGAAQLPAGYAEALRHRHAGVLALAAVVRAHPYSVPVPEVPDALVAVARYVEDPAPVGPAARTALAEFKRTHVDSWHIDQMRMDPEQVAALADVLVSPSYYA